MEKRIARSYKIENAYYEKAMTRAAKENAIKLANLLERVVQYYSEGYEVTVHHPKTNPRLKIDLSSKANK